MGNLTFVLESRNPYIDHDRLFKELIQTFFKEFMEAFFSAEYAKINFSNVKFLDQEVYTDILKGEKRRIDILAEVTLAGEEKVVLIHVEPQATYQNEFHERMFIYCSRLYEKHRKPILPIAVFSYNDKREVPAQFNLEFPAFNIVKFQYLQLHLINENWLKYIKSNNPAVAALLSKMGYAKQDRIKVKVEFLRMISRLELDPAKMKLIYGFFETYLILTDEEETQMREEIMKLPKEEAEKVLELPNSYFDKGVERGFEQGMEQGIKHGIEQGKKAQTIEVAKKLLSKEVPLDDIVDITALSLEEVERLARSRN